MTHGIGVEDGQSDEHILLIYKELREVGKVRWKESIKEVAGLDMSSEPGLDI